MPSVNVPLKGQPGWDELMRRRRAFWRKGDNNKLTPNFRGHEFDTHDGTPCPTSARPAIVALCRTFLEPMRKRFGTAYVLSGYRHRLYNQAIGGARNSQHIWEEGFESVAADMRFAKGSPAQWAAEARRLRTKSGGRGGVGRYDRSGFV